MFRTANDTTADPFTAVTDAAARYRGAMPGLSTDDERGLITAAQLGNEYAKVELIARYEARLRRMVSRANVGAADVPDLQQAAALGVLDALPRVDVNAGNGAFTYLRNSIAHELAEANRTSDAKPAERNAARHYWASMAATDSDAATARAWSALQRLSAVELEEIAEDGEENATVRRLAREIVDARWDRWERKPNGKEWEDVAAERGRGLDGPTWDAIHASVTYLDAPVTSDGDGDTTGHDVLGEPDEAAPTASVEDRLTVAVLLGKLPERDRYIMRALFGIDGEPMTASAVADMCGISRPRVQNIRKASLRKLATLAAA